MSHQNEDSPGLMAPSQRFTMPASPTSSEDRNMILRSWMSLPSTDTPKLCGIIFFQDSVWVSTPDGWQQLPQDPHL